MGSEWEFAEERLCHMVRQVDLEKLIRILNIADPSDLAADVIGGNVSAARALSAWLRQKAYTVAQARPLLALVGRALAGPVVPKLAWTAAPNEGNPTELTTAVAVADLISSTQTRLIVAGYRVSEATIRAYALDTLSSSIEVIVIVDAAQLSTRDMLDIRRIGVTVFPIKNDRTNAAKFHIKAIVSDERRVLITSANFTELGQRENVELGVILNGSIAADVANVLLRITREARA